MAKTWEVDSVEPIAAGGGWEVAEEVPLDAVTKQTSVGGAEPMANVYDPASGALMVDNGETSRVTRDRRNAQDDPRRLDRKTGAKIADDVAFLAGRREKLAQANAGTKATPAQIEALAQSEMAGRGDAKTYGLQDRVAGYQAKGMSATEATRNAVFDATLEQRLNEPFQKAKPSANGERIGTDYQPEREAARVKKQGDDLASLRDDIIGRNAAGEMNATWRGATKGGIQSAALTAGTVGFIGDVFGSDALRQWGLEKYDRGMKLANQLTLSKNASDIRSADDLTEWLAENAGYVAYQAAEAIVTGGAGSAIGKQVGKDTLVTAVGLGLNSMRQTLGSVYGEAVEEAKSSGKPMPSLLQVFGGAAASAAVDALADKIGLDAITAKGFKGNVLSRVGKSVGSQVAVQGGTEAAQLVPEEWGAGRDPFREGMAKQYFDEAAVGALGGAGPGVLGAATRNPQDLAASELARALTTEPVPSEAERSAAVDQERVKLASLRAGAIADIGAASSVDEAIAAAQLAINLPTEGPLERMGKRVKDADLLSQALRAAGVEHADAPAVASMPAPDTATAPAPEPSPTPIPSTQPAAAQEAPAPMVMGRPAAELQTGQLLQVAKSAMFPEPVREVARQEVKRREIEAMYAQRAVAPQAKAAEEQAIVEAVRDERVEQAEAMTSAQTVDAPTAMQLAFQRAQAQKAPTQPKVAHVQDPAPAPAATQAGAPAAPTEAAAPARADGAAPARVPQPGTTSRVEADGVAAPVELGRNNQPISEGGKPFKTRAEVDAAKKLQPLMRVKKVKGGFILIEKTPAQIAAQAKAARRLGGTGVTGAMAAHELLASLGGLSKSTMADLGFDRNVRVGARWLFSGNGGLSLERATEALQQNGFMDGTDQAQGVSIIQRSAKGQPQYTAEGWEQIAKAEAESRFEDHLAAQQEAAQEEDFDPFASMANDGYVLEDAQAAGLGDAAPEQLTELLAGLDQLEAIGQDLDSIAERIALQYPDATQQEYHELVQNAINEAISGSAQPRGDRNDGQVGSGQTDAAEAGAEQDAAEGELLSSPTRADIEAQQERADAAARQEAADRQRADQEDAAARERAEVARRSEAAADTFELGQDPMANLTGQKDIFGAATEDDTPPAQPAKPIQDTGEKIGGARKDRWKERGLNLDDLDSMTEAEGAELATKANVWKPDYEALAEASEPVTAAMVKVIYDRLAAKPGKNTPDGRRQYVQMMRIVRDVLTEVKGPEAAKNAYLEIRQRAGLNTMDLQAKATARALLFSVYKGRSDPFVFSYNELSKAKKMVEDGFPGKSEPWKTRLVVGRREGGPGTTERGFQMYAEKSAELGTPLTREQIEAGFFRVLDKKNNTLAYAATKEDAEAAAKTIYERDMKGGKEGKPEPERPHLDELKRENLPQRIDRDVTADDFMKAFGFRGVEFGNWSAQDERQRIINMAYDGLMDLAEIMGVPAQAMSLNGTLGMAFGARGGGRFLAHYEPGKLVINMTKLRGGGSLAHEWAHALDHYFGELDKADAYTTQARGASGWMTEDQYSSIPRRRMEMIDGQWKSVEKTRLDNLRPEMARAFDALMRAIFQTQITKAEMVRGQELDLERTEAMALTEENAELKAMYQRMAINKRQALDELRQDPEDTMYAGRGRTEFANQAQALSGKSAKGYWTRPTEMLARSFESWVFDRVTAMGARSDYLVHGVEEDRFAGGGYKGNPYPTGEERARINAAFEKLAATIKTKETEQGVMMYARDAGFNDAVDAAVNAAMKGEKPARQNVKIGTTPPALIAAGIPSGEMQTSPSVLAKVVFDHGVPKSVLKKVPDLLENPVMVFDSDTVAGSYAVVTNEFVNGKPLLVIVSPEQTRGGVTFNFVPSLYPKDHLVAIQKWLDTGKLRYLDKKQSPSWFGSSRLQLPTEYRSMKGLQARNVATELDLVKADDSALSRPFDADMFSRIMRPLPTGMSMSDVRAAVAEVTASWKNAPPIRVVATSADLPLRNAPVKSRGVYDGQTVWIVAGNQRSVGQVFKTLAHEAIAHHGLRAIQGDQWDKTMQVMQVALKSGNKALAELRDEVRSAYVDEQGNFNLTASQEADEIAARAVEHAIDPITGEFRTGMGWLKSVYARVAAWLREIGIPVAFTNLELQGMLARAQEHLRSAGGAMLAPNDLLPEGAMARDSSPTDLAAAKVMRDASTFDEARAAAKAFQGRLLKNAETGMEAVVSRNSLDKMLSSKAVGKSESPALHAAAVANLDDLFVRAVLGWSKPDRAQNSNIAAIHRYFAPMKIGGNVLLAKLTVKETVDPTHANPIYSVEAVEFNEKAPAAQWVDAAVQADGLDPTSIRSAGAVLSLAEQVQNYNQGDSGVAFARDNDSPGRFRLDPENWRGKTRRVMQDYFLRVRRVQEAIASQGGLVDETTDTYLAEELSYGRIQESLKDFANKMVKPMIEKAQAAGIDMDELALYAYAKHAKERNAQIANIDPKMPDGGSGMTDAEADAILARAAPKRADFESLHADLMAMTATTRQTLWQEGLITEDEFHALDGMYDNYVPLRGFELKDDDGKPSGMRAGKGFNVRGKETMRALGRQSRAGDVIENIIADYERAVVRAERNQVGKVFLNFVLQNPDASLWEVDATRTKKALDRQTGLVARDTAIEKGEDTIAVKVAGREVYIQIHDDLLARAMRNAHKDETGEAERALIKAVGLYATLMRNTLTRFNPEFALVNTIRDFGFGTAAALDKLGEKGAAKFMKHYAGAYAASARAELGKSDPSNRAWDRWYEEYRAAGGTTGGFYTKGADEIRSDIRTILLQAGASPKDWKEKVQASGPMQLARAAGRVLEFAGAASENAARVAAYRAAREMGKSPSEAASIAKNLTTNFNRRGEAGQLLNSLFVFYNAAIQGAQRTAAMLKNPKMQGYLAAGTAGALALALANATAGGDDEDDGQAYWDKIPDYVKERNLIIMLPPATEVDGAEKVGTKGRYIAIPVQYGLNIFTVVGYNVADLIRHSADETRGKSWLQAGARIASTVFDSFNPFGSGMDNVHSAAMTVMPSVLDVVYQYAAGVNGFGRPTSPGKSDTDTSPDSENVNARQSGGIAHRVARWVNSVTGGDEAEPGLVDVAPGTLEQTWRNLTGGTGMFIGDVLTIAAKQIDDQFGGGENDYFVRDIPIFRKVYGEADGDVDQSLFYERRRQITEARTVEKRKAELGRDFTDRRQVALASMATDGNKFARALSGIRKEMIAVGKDDEMSDSEKKVRLRELKVERDDLTREFNRLFMDTMRDLRDGVFDADASN